MIVMTMATMVFHSCIDWKVYEAPSLQMAKYMENSIKIDPSRELSVLLRSFLYYY